ncbi:NAD-glutamate dehydrogenase [Amorphus orientalis]|uniref:Glutamate dehydrogenase n=1 Tax=Amorphus orientalis TaxID=649198 RepID=A0AAE4ASW6_9HYPH|nr:NAD-glutamate dehydrogenase [Amorphus orientalis]MDQ0316706.1 glutamate dehydrogenase [Amorphus orientalis]
MLDRYEAEKAERIAAAVTRLAGDDSDDQRRRFAEAFFARGSAEDIVVYDDAELCALADRAWTLFQKRAPGAATIEITEPDLPSTAQATRDVTVIDIVNDNMPFLFDSLMDELIEFGVEVRLVLHPIFACSRDETGQLQAFVGEASGGEAGNRESFIHIHVRRIESQERREELLHRLRDTLKDVRVAVSDWQEMRGRVQAIVERYKASEPPIEASELAKATSFLEWLVADEFIFLGLREYRLEGDVDTGELEPVFQSGLGLLRDPEVRVLRRGTEFVVMTPEIREFLRGEPPLIVTKANARSRVHRHVHLDFIGIKNYADDGRLSGETRLVGLFSSRAYTSSVRNIPYVREKVNSVLDRAGYAADSHSGKALLNVLESYPRDELFQIDTDLLYQFATAILELGERPRIRVLARSDAFERFVSVLVFVPSDRYTTEQSDEIGAYLARIFDGRVSATYVGFPEGPLARIHYIIGRYEGETPQASRETLEAGVAQLVRTWTDDLEEALTARHGLSTARRLSERFAEAFDGGYRATYSAETAVTDIAIIDRMSDDRPVAISFFRRSGDAEHRASLKLFAHEAPIPLSDRVPIIEAMGFRVINERTFRVEHGTEHGLYVHDMSLARIGGGSIDLDVLASPLEAMFMAVWTERAESDGFNALLLASGLGWRDIAMLRALSRYLRQANVPYSQDYIWGALIRYPVVAKLLVDLFHVRFDPSDADKDRSLAAARLQEQIDAELDTVTNLDDDTIIRRFTTIIYAMLRTNYFRLDKDGTPPDTFAFKLFPGAIDILPAPRPYREIWVYSPRVEGVHLRFGEVARGGLRWSDRSQDFRTEILGLVKAQQVKNAVIVPVGAKGGFVPKKLPATGGREAVFAEGTEAYKIFINALLSVTDNLVEGKPVPPTDVVRHDGDDPYLVVAADKGTATFSDTANAIAENREFWLGDAFASGGSQGYDHKAMGITARGAWEAVKRHFREMDVDIQTTPFTVIGVGDMSGDVFGNGMLLSKAIRLVAAFDHRDIFIDPDPDPDTSWTERKRLFDAPRTSWQDYDTSLISKGGGVFSRSAKSVPLSPEAQALLGLNKSSATPLEVIRAILRTESDLLWFGGIGTYVRAASETNLDVGDRANDSIRITAEELRVKVIGEGANLGVTQKARIAFARGGGRCNSDAIDNSAGVNTSDVEVNIKIALRGAESQNVIDREKRNEVLVAMTDEVASIVLRNNYLQTLSISLTQRLGIEDIGFQSRLMQVLEQRGVLDRELETLPPDRELSARAGRGEGLCRPEIGVLLAYAKITLYDALLSSSVPDDTYLGRELRRYFPTLMQEDFLDQVEGHPLRREIIATVLANSMINRGGPTFVTRMADQTGADVDRIAKAFAACRDAWQLTALNGEIDALDTRVPGDVQLELYAAVQDLVLDATVWFIRNVRFEQGIQVEVERFRAGLQALEPNLEKVVPEHIAGSVDETARTWIDAGVPEDLAHRLSHLPVSASIPDIIVVSEATGAPLEKVAETYFAIDGRFRIGRIEALARQATVTDYYDGLALDRARRTLAEAHRQITRQVIAAGGEADASLAVENWIAERAQQVDRALKTVTQLGETDTITVSRFAVAASLLADVAGE